jgi:mono/diheme cytochrome c family protein
MNILASRRARLVIRPAAALLMAFGLVALAPGQSGPSNAIARGKYLYDAADCAGCHAAGTTNAAPSGGLGLDTPFGTFRVPNITAHAQYGLGTWSLAEFRRALRLGIGKHGEYLFPVFPYTSFTGLSDQDVDDLYAYLMSLPPQAVPNRPHQATPPFGWRPLLIVWRELFFRAGPLAVDATRTQEWNRGNYLAHAVAHCEECHTPRNLLGGLKSGLAFSGNVGGPDGQNAPNITPDSATGIGDWSVEDIQRLLKTGMTPESDLVGSGMKAVVRATAALSDADRHAIAVYLKSVPPVHVTVPAATALRHEP